MIASEFVAATLLRATGKVFTGSSTDPKYIKVLGIGNQMIDAWESEPDSDWESLYTPDYSLGAVTATDTFPIDTDDVRKISQERGDSIRIVHTDDNWTDYQLVEPDKLKQFTEGYYCARVGNNLVFNHVFEAADPQFGGDIQVPKYGYATHLVNPTDVVTVDIPNWLVVMSAAEFVRNDIVRQNQYPNLVAEANQLMLKMKENQEAQVNSVTRVFSAAGQSWA